MKRTVIVILGKENFHMGELIFQLKTNYHYFKLTRELALCWLSHKVGIRLCLNIAFKLSFDPFSHLLDVRRRYFKFNKTLTLTILQQTLKGNE